MEKLLSFKLEHWVEMDQTHSKGKLPQQNMTVFSMKIAGAIDVAENNHEYCNKTFKQVLSFLSNLTSALFILRIALSSLFEVSFGLSSKKMLFQAFPDTANWIYNI